VAAVDELAARLLAAGVAGGSTGWGLYRGYLPDEPDAAVAIFETGGPPPDTRAAVEYPSFQLRVRGPAEDYATARTRIEAVRAALHGREAELGDAWVYLHAQHSGVQPLGRDARRRPGFVLNFIAMRRR